MPPSDRGSRSKAEGAGEPGKSTPAKPAFDVDDIIKLMHAANRPESKAELSHRLEASAKDLEHQRKIEMIVLTAVLLILPFCLWELFDASRPPANKTWAAPVVTLIVGNLFGYAAGRRLPKTLDK
jgi:hypothetical protein